MFLKAIDIFGFKSFPEKIKIEFPKGISSFVGPNGCGKSNIVDSIKWVLGEHSTKMLRAQRMEDVIFNGTEQRKALNVAEVELTLLNEDGHLPIDISEISIKRRLFRSGESEYYVNNKLVKLKELKELFYDTGIGKSSYSVMEQGKIDQILSNKPEERRYIFEEAAGITKYKIKGQEAERKLIKTEENIKHAQAILAEVKKSYDTLKIQARKTEEYRGLKDELFDSDVKMRLLRLRSLLENKAQKETKHEKEMERKTSFQLEIDRINEMMEKNIDLVNTMELKLVEHQKTLYGINIEKNNLESQVRLLKDRIIENERKIESDRLREKACLKKIKELKNELEQRQNTYKEVESQIQEIEKNINDFKVDINHFSNRIEQNNSEIKQKENEIIQIEKELEIINTELKQITEDIVTQLDENLKETGYSYKERKKLETSIEEYLNTFKIQLEGKLSILEDANKLSEVNKNEIEKIIGAMLTFLTELIDKVQNIYEYFNMYKKATPSFIDEALSPKGIIIQKREIDEKINKKRARIIQNKKRISELREENSSISLKIEEYRKTLENLNINRASMLTQRKGLKEVVEMLDRDIIEQNTVFDETKKTIEATMQNLKDIEDKITSLESRKKELETNEEKLSNELSEIENSIGEKNKNLGIDETKLKEKMNSLLLIQENLEKLQTQIAELNVEIKNVYTNFSEQYSRELDEFEGNMHDIYTSTKELKERVSACREKIKKCGQVNLMAPEEFLEVKERYEFLTDQIEDLHKAREDLKIVTKEIRQESTDLFLDTYNKIRNNFHIMFRRLFGGGRAELKLSDPKNILESGIEILTQPPGKKLENIDLLSGGEKSLTAVALLFATYMVKPSPFCILDEIDAALDEENIGRFINLLSEFTHSSQFIIVTHNKRTISGANALFGITMEESGVSKIISVKLKEREKKESYV